MERIIKKGQTLIVRGTEGEGLTARGRKMRSPFTQVVEFKHPNKYYSIRLEHIAGPLSGVQFFFSLALARKASNSPICTCGAYSYPHRPDKLNCKTTGDDND